MTLALSDLVVGSTFKSPRLEVDESEALAFAKRFDPQPFHTDSAAAKDSLFKGLATSGWYTAAASFRLILESGINLRGGIVGHRIEEMHWLRPLRPGDTLQVLTEVVDVTRSEKNPCRGTVTFKHVAVNGRQEPILEMRAVVLASDHDPVIPQFEQVPQADSDLFFGAVSLRPPPQEYRQESLEQGSPARTKAASEAEGNLVAPHPAAARGQGP